jgi:hypothetical protein
MSLRGYCPVEHVAKGSDGIRGSSGSWSMGRGWPNGLHGHDALIGTDPR